MEVMLLTNESSDRMQAVLVRYEIGGATSEYVRLEGEVFVHILGGRIGIDIQGEGEILLEEGDSAYFTGGSPRRYRNIGTEPASLIRVLARKSGS